MDKIKMPRVNRAKQFAPFNALRDLQEALRLKEYEHEKILKGDLSEEQANKFSKLLINFNKEDIFQITYFNDGYNLFIEGKIKLNMQEHCVICNNRKIYLDDIVNLEIIS